MEDIRKRLYKMRDSVETIETKVDDLQSAAFAISDAMLYSPDDNNSYQGAVHLIAYLLFQLKHELKQIQMMEEG